MWGKGENQPQRPQRTPRHPEMHTNKITGEIVDAAIKVHTAVGPGLLESAYESCLCAELCRRDLRVQRQVGLPVVYEGERLDLGYRLDLLVEDEVIVEIKAVSVLAGIHRAQMLSYLRLSGRRIGIILNFNVVRMREGIVRLVDRLDEP